MLNGWFSSNDDICPVTSFLRFKLKDKCRSEKWEVYLYGDFPSWWTVVVWKCCPGVCLRLGFHPIGNGSHHLWVLPPSERGTGMSMPSWHDGFSF